jgi:hypothetical protein
MAVHDGLAAMEAREAQRNTARRCCRAWELIAGWIKGGGHSGDPYWLHKRVVEGWRRAGGEVEPAAAVKLWRLDDTGAESGVKGGTR